MFGLNLGCGCRSFPSRANSAGTYFEWLNLDRDEGAREHAQLAGAKFDRHDLLDRLPFGPCFDLVNMAQVFEHFQLHDAIVLLGECRRVLKPGGCLRISVPDARLLINKFLAREMDEFTAAQPPVFAVAKSQMLKLGLILFGALHKHGEDGHKQCYDEEALREVLELVRFTRIERVGFDPDLDAPVAANHQLAMTARKPMCDLGAKPVNLRLL